MNNETLSELQQWAEYQQSKLPSGTDQIWADLLEVIRLARIGLEHEQRPV